METRESETLKFKKSTAQLKEAVILICAMLNQSVLTVPAHLLEQPRLRGGCLSKRSC